MDFQELIDKGDELKKQKYNSPSVKLWKNDVRAAVAPYGEENQNILNSALCFNQMIMSVEHGKSMHRDAISNTQVLLKELQKRKPEDAQAQSELINQKMEEARTTLGSKFGTTTFNGPVTFGNNSPANNIQVGEIMLAIINQVKKDLPEGPEKKKILDELNSITANPTFAAIASTALPKIIKSLFG